MMTENKVQDALLELFKDPQPIEWRLTKSMAWQLMSAIQLACRHPGFKGSVRDTTESMARHLQDALCANDNDLRQLAEMGWHQQFDDVQGEKPQPHLSDEEINFLHWALGFAHGRALDSGDQAKVHYIREHVDSIRNKLNYLGPPRQ